MAVSVQGSGSRNQAEARVGWKPSVGPLDEVTCVRGESFVVSQPNGDVDPGHDHGLYVRDTRFLNRFEVLVNGAAPDPLNYRAGSATATFFGYVPRATSRAVDPEIVVIRRRVVDGAIHEEIEIENHGQEVANVVVEVMCGTDFAYIFDVKHGRTGSAHAPTETEGGIRFRRDGGTDEVEVTASPLPDVAGDVLRFPLTVTPKASRSICLDVIVRDVYGTVAPGRRCEAFVRHERRPVTAPADAPEIRCSDRRFERLVRQSLRDIATLQLPDPDAPTDRFCAAGSPWFLTLFGRDSLWAAFMPLPFDVSLAGGTLRTLARRQGTRHDPDTEEAPGKILHEVRRGSLTHRGDLPPNYYGSIDATPLFIILLSEAWRFGLPGSEVVDLLPNLTAALDWLANDADPDGDGFIEYIRHGARGLDNQGWKDSHDGVQFHDGRLAEAPIALAEVQSYVHDAAVRAADMLDHFGRHDGQAWRVWARDMRERFRGHFWVQDDRGPYPGIALDRENTVVDTVTSNMGHLLLGDMLSEEECAVVAARLRDDTMSSGWGLRTMASTSAGYNPFSYHGGSVWPHDTAIAAWGLARTGDAAAAADLLRGLVRAAPHYDYRLPELLSGMPYRPGGVPVPYPVACRPQAWSAGAGLLLLRACLGLDPRVPEGVVRLSPITPAPFQRLTVHGLPVAGGRLDVRIDADRGIDAQLRDSPIRLEVDDAHA